MRKDIFNFLSGFIGGILAFSLIFGFVNLDINSSISERIDAAITERNNGLVKVKETPLPSGGIDFWQKISVRESLNVVLVQTLVDGKIYRQGSGVILSSDGLIVTTNDVAPLGFSNYRVFNNKDSFKGQVVSRDILNNLALIKISDVSNLDVSSLNTIQKFQSGQDLIITGKVVDISDPVVFSQKALVSYVTTKDIILDTVFNNFISGAKAINTSGQTVGIVYIRNQRIHLVDSSTIDGFLKEYFEANK